MANKTVKLTSYVFNGRTGLTLLLLHPVTGAIGNGAGDALAAGANGLFTTTVTEAITGYWRVVVLDGSVPLIENEWIRFKSDVEGVYVVDDPKDAAENIYVLPTKGTQQDRRVSKDEIEIYKTEGYTLVRTVTDATGANVDLSSKTLELIIEGENRNDKAVIPDADIAVSGTGNATYTIEIPTTVSAKADKTYNFYLWDKTTSARPKMLDQGKFIITYAGTSGTT